MKIIDLLVKMANGEAPKRIKYDDIEYFLYDDYTYMKKDKSRLMCSVFFKRLNDEVEVIEDLEEIYIEKLERLDKEYIIPETKERHEGCKDKERYHADYDSTIIEFLKNNGNEKLAELFEKASKHFWYA